MAFAEGEDSLRPDRWLRVQTFQKIPDRRIIRRVAEKDDCISSQKLLYEPCRPSIGEISAPKIGGPKNQPLNFVDGGLSAFQSTMEINKSFQRLFL